MIIFSLSILIIPFLLLVPVIRLNNKAKWGLYIFTTLYFIFTSWISFMIYTSLMSESLPWYEPCGMQFLIIIVYSTPALIAVGIVNIILARFIKLSKTAKIFPFIIAVALVLPVLIDGSLGYEMQIIGAALSIIGAVGIIIITIRELIREKNTHDAK